MINQSAFRDLVSGQRRGFAASLMRGILRGCEWPYSWAVRLRNWRYDRGRADIHRVAVPVISIGNLTLGGTGKTPLVEWIARRFRERSLRVAIVSRGYGAEANGQNDEALELKLALPDVPHVQNPERVAASQQAVEVYRAEVIVLDDGFQHRRLARDVDIVLLDATEPFGFEHVFPRGTLREPLSGLARARVAVLSRANMLDQRAREKIRRCVLQLSPEIAWCELMHCPQGLIGASGKQSSISSASGKRVAAFCGIGNPAGFRHTLSTLGCEVVTWLEFADHHNYSSDDVQSLVDWAADAEMALCTRKDLVKLRLESLGNVPLFALQVEIEFLAGQSELEAALEHVLQNIK